MSAFGATGVSGAGALNLLVVSQPTNGSPNGAVTLLASSTAGNFSVISSLSVSPNAVSAAVGKVGKDTALDLVVANGSDDSFSVYRNTGGGSFTLVTNVTVNSGDVVRAAAVADVNGDGKGDVIVAAGNSVYVYYGLGNGTLNPTNGPAIYTVGSAPVSLAVADVNKDGKLDVVTANSGERRHLGADEQRGGRAGERGQHWRGSGFGLEPERFGPGGFEP